MTEALQSQNQPAGNVDDFYRRTSALDPSRPSEWVRRKVLAHAAQVVAEHAVKDNPGARAPKAAPTPATEDRPAKPTASSNTPMVFAAIGVVAVAGIVVAWHFLSPHHEPLAAVPPPLIPEPLPPRSAASESAPVAKADDTADAPEPPAATASAQSAQAPEPAVAATPSPASQAPEPAPAAAMSRSAAPTTTAQHAPAPAQRPAPPPVVASTAVAHNQAQANNRGARQATAQNAGSASISAETEAQRAPAAEPPVAAQPAAVVHNDVQTPPQAPAPAVAPPAPPPPVAAAPAPAQAVSPEVLWRAADSGDVKALEAAIDAKVDVNAQDSAGRTALMRAAVHAHGAIVRKLLEHGANPNTPDAKGVTPIRAALTANQPNIVADLKKAGARWIN